MKLRKLLLIIFVFFVKLSNGQSYFDLFYTNIPKSKFDNYSILNSQGLGWIQTGNYTSPAGCSNCSDYSKDSKLTKEHLDSLAAAYRQSGLAKIYAKQYVPNNSYFAADNKVREPYIIKALYKIEGNKPIAAMQLKMTFYEKDNKKAGIKKIEILDLTTFKALDSKIVMDSYRKVVKEDSDEKPPIIQN